MSAVRQPKANEARRHIEDIIYISEAFFESKDNRQRQQRHDWSLKFYVELKLCGQ